MAAATQGLEWIPAIVIYSLAGLIGALIVGFCLTLPWATPWDPWIAAVLWLAMVAFMRWLLQAWNQSAIAIDLRCRDCGKQWIIPAEALRFGRTSSAARDVARFMRSTPSLTDQITPE